MKKETVHYSGGGVFEFIRPRLVERITVSLGASACDGMTRSNASSLWHKVSCKHCLRFKDKRVLFAVLEDGR